MRKQVIVLLVVSALFVMACDVSGLVSQFIPGEVQQQAEQAVETAVPETGGATPEAPSETEAAPTKAISGGPSSGNPFADALSKAQGVTKYRVEFSMIMGGMENGKYAETPLIDLTGEVDGKNSHMVSKGGMLSMLSDNPNTPVEFLEVNGQSYMKGSSMFGTRDPGVWYIEKDDSSSSFSSMATPKEFASFTGGANPGDFQQAGSEALDGQTCNIYVYDMKSLQNSAISGLLGLAGDKNAFSVIDKAQTSFWLCGDGYVHKFSLDYEGHSSADATQKGGLKMVGHTWDYGDPAIVIQAPQGAKPAP